MAQRPNMHTKNSSGHSVSLLNDDSAAPQPRNQPQAACNYGPHPSLVLRNQSEMQRSYSNHSALSMDSAPRTPGLERSHSYDSNNTSDPITPITPMGVAEMGRQPFDHSKDSTYEGRRQFAETHVYSQYSPTHLQMPPMRSMYGDPGEPLMTDPPLYAQDTYGNGMMVDRGLKRYPCRYKDMHHCEKTFTTSGHASRHSKIHTAEKAVHCSHPGCSKKFTRSDNMKQHLETHNKHNKDRSRNQISNPKALTRSAGVSKPLPRSPSRLSAERSPFSPSYQEQGYEYPSPEASHASFDHALPMTGLTIQTSAGLDTLAAVAHQMQHQR